MIRQELIRLGVLTVAAVAFGVLLALGLGHAQRGPSLAQEEEGGAVAVDCSAELDGVQDECDYPSGGEFTIQIHVIEFPAGGYATVQVKPTWTEDVLDYLPTPEEADETVWSVCVDDPLIFARFNNSFVGNDPTVIEPSFIYSCLPSSITTEPELAWSDTGAIFQFSFVCIADETATLELIPFSLNGETDRQEGTHFTVPTETEGVTHSLKVNPETLSDATINCGVAPEPGPEVPEPELPSTGTSGIEAEGRLSSGLWAVIGSLLAATAGGLIAFGWREARSR